MQSTICLRLVSFTATSFFIVAAVIAQDVDQDIRDATEAVNRISSVTIFRSQANVVREVRINASDQQQNICISGLPKTLRDRSLRWESDAEITVQSLQILPHKIPSYQADQQERQTQIEKQNTAIQDASHQVAVIEQDLKTIEDLVEFSSTKTQDTLNHSKLDVNSVTEIADFLMLRRRKLATELHQARRLMQQEQRKAEESMIQAMDEAASEQAATFDAVLTVDAPKGGLLRISYWVNGVSWEPHYTIHATADPTGKDNFVVQLDGSVSQHSGEDWDDIELTFCTGVPNLQAASPLLVPLRVSVNQVNQDGASARQGIPGPGIRSPTSAMESAPAWEDLANLQHNLELNTEAAGRQVHEINRRQSVQRELAGDANNNLADETYRVAGKIKIADQTTGQAVAILRSNVSSSIYRVVTPLLNSFAYREALLDNVSGQSLVGGDATVILNGRFVGRTTLPPTAAGGEFTVGLGADRQVRTRRELLTRDETIQGANRLSKLKYRLVISNYHSAAIDIRLYDRIPITDDAGTVNVIADSDSLGQLSEDAKYLRMQRPTGILRWDLAIPAKRFGSDAYDHHYRYTVEVDRTQTIVSNNVEQKMQKDLRFNRSGGGGMGGGGFGGGGSF